jgi:Domain of unknown function (DUF1840)
MLYQFKSQATGNLILLEATGRRILGLIGKEPSAAQGIVLVAQIPAAITALQSAIAAEEAWVKTQMQTATQKGEIPTEPANNTSQSVSLRQRAQPFITLLQRAQAEGYDVTWGV